MTAAITTRNLTRCFGDICAVDHITLEVASGTFYGFLGPNGAGKSTTIKLLTGLMAPTHGEILVLGHDMTAPDAALQAKRKMGVIPENLALFESLTARETLIFQGRIHQLPRTTIRERSEELLKLLELEDEETKLVGEYSHGMRKKLSLAAALLSNPQLLFLDEPFEGVDAITNHKIVGILRSFVARGGTIFLSTHILPFVEKLCTHVGIIIKGQLVEQGPIDEIRRDSDLETKFLRYAGVDATTTDSLTWLGEMTHVS